MLAIIDRYLRTGSKLIAIAAALIVAVLVEHEIQRAPDGSPYVNDAVQFWCAAQLIRDGRSPYDVEGQAALSDAAGWNANRHGAGRYRFMPFYYPFWVGLAALPLSWMSFSYFVAAWSVLQHAALIAAAVILCRMPERFPRTLGILLIVFFPLATQTAQMGQVANLFLLGVAVVWWCGERGRDLTAGAALSLLCSKPQLGVLLIPCVLLWAFRQKRFRVIAGFAMGLAALVGVSLLMRPEWLFEFLRAPQETPMLTAEEPWKLTTWFAVLKTAGLNGIDLGILYAAAAIPSAAMAFRTSWKRGGADRHGVRPLQDAMAVALLAVFFVSPYARSYDMVVLLFPTMVLLRRIAVIPRAVVLLFAVLLPHYHQLIRWQRAAYPVAGLEIWWLWMPAVLMLLWIAAERGWIAAWNLREAEEVRTMAAGRPT